MGENEVHKGTAWGLWVLSPYHTRGEVSIFCQTASESRELRHVCQRTRYTRGERGGGAVKSKNKNKKKSSQSTFNDTSHKVVRLTADMWGGRGVGVVGRSPSCPPPWLHLCHVVRRTRSLTAISQHKQERSRPHLGASACRMCPFQNRWEAPETRGTNSSRTGRNGERARLIRSSIIVSTLAVLHAALWQIYRRHLLQHRHPEPESWGDAFGSSQG